MDYSNHGLLQSQSYSTEITGGLNEAFQRIITFTHSKTTAAGPIREKRLLNARLPIDQLPVEIFIKIIFFTGHTSRHTIRVPYAMVFSWVCHSWRSAILGNPLFWKTIFISKNISTALLQKFLRRSRDLPLGLVIGCHLSKANVHALTPLRRFPDFAVRFKTLYLNTDFATPSGLALLHILISAFPSLENIFYRNPPYFPIDFSIVPSCIQPQLKSIQIYIRNISSLSISSHFCQLRWLTLTYNACNIALVSLLEALENLPSLQTLHLFKDMSNNSGAGALKPPIITLRELTVLVSNCPLLHLITAPKLLYLDVYIEYPTQSRIEDTYDHLCGFNFSTITQIRTAVKPSCSYFVTGRRNSACSEWEDLIEFDWRLPLDMYRYTSGPSPRWIFDEVPASGYPNQFHISFGSGWKWDRQPASILSSTFSLYIEKAANLVEIVLEELDLTPPFTGRARINSFTNALRKATTVRYLTVLSSQSFEDFCEFFADSTLIPNLQRLSYTPAGPNYEGKSGPARIYFSLRDLANGRLGLATYLRQPRSLEIELKNVPYIPPWEVKEIESLGSRLKWEGGGNRVNLFMTLTDGPDFKKMIEDTFSRAHEPST